MTVFIEGKTDLKPWPTALASCRTAEDLY
jgi:hypothetical protein